MGRMTDHSEDGGPPTTALLVTTDGRRRYLTFNRPEVLNALNRELTRAFATAVKEFTLDDSVHVAIINGAGGRSFSTGGDLKEMSTRIDGPAARGGHDVPTAESVPWYGPLLRCDKPVVAAIDGYCIAAGF